MNRDLIAYYKSITDELHSLKDRVRHLISDSHWLTDGLHKEVIIRKVLSNHLPESLRIGTGFVCVPETSNQGRLNTTQIDILVTRRDQLTLFKEDALSIVTANSVVSIIEVKTKLNNSTVADAINKIASDANLIREYGNANCIAGLFVYEDTKTSHRRTLESLAKAAGSNRKRVVDLVAVGNSKFYKFWDDSSRVNGPIVGPAWHAYELHSISHAYFINNIAWETSCNEKISQFAWFPLVEGKEAHLVDCISL